MHAESGFLKIMAGEGVERKAVASYSHIFGMNEFEFGTINANTLHIKADEERHFQRPNVVREEEEKSQLTSHIERVYTLVDNGSIEFKTFLGVGGGEPKLHNKGTLVKVCGTNA